MRRPLVVSWALVVIVIAVASSSFASRLVISLASDAAPRAAIQLTDRLKALGLVYQGTLADGITRPAGAGELGPLDRVFGLDPARVWVVEASDSTAAELALAALRLDPAIEWAELDQMRTATWHRAHDFPDDPMFQDGRQWGLWNLGAAGPFRGIAGADIDARGGWALGVGSNELRLAFADTGIDPGHPELATVMPDGRPRIELGSNLSGDPSGAFADSVGHGTPVAAVMAALTGEGAHGVSLGMAGVCGGDGRGNLGCRLVPIKISAGHATTAHSSTIARAILYATSAGARVMNLSFAGGGPSALERRALYHAITRGCVVVAASGNDGWRDGSAARYPAAYAAEGLAIQVGSSDTNDRRSVWSSHGPGLDFLAPGEDIWSASLTYPSWNGTFYPGYQLISGTSFAAPHATGAAGLLAAARPELRDVDFQRLLRESADDLGEPGVDAMTGWGRLNIARALAAVPPSFGIWHDEVAAAEYRLEGRDTLFVAESAAGPLAPFTGRVLAERIAVSATIAVPDSFVDSLRVWPTVGGTTTLRPIFRLPYLTPHAEVVRLGARTFTLRGYVYRAWPEGAGGPVELPVPLDQARFGFTVIGKVKRETRVSRPLENVLRASPNPFREALEIALPGPGRLTIADVHGRRVRQAIIHGTMPRFLWDGRDPSGRVLPAGLYFVRHEMPTAIHYARVVRLD
ncbi:MAG TPA: S8 family serine peptidase [Candidatus Limnocylindria bacterium]|nr:S8 family serine peptidase [Candidatus Limnocylindria bacterium]